MKNEMINQVINDKSVPTGNPALRIYAEQYNRIEQNFMDQVRKSGIEICPDGEDGKFEARVATLKKKGAKIRNDFKSIYINRISPACQACQTGVGSATYFISLKCHRDCFYCFNPNQEGYEFFREHKRDLVAELQTLKESKKKIRQLALTGGEPLLYKQDAIQFFLEARKDFPGVYTRLYTCGDQVERETLQALKDAAVDEIRFSIRLQDLARGQRRTFDQIALAREYIPQVMVEMPVLPDSLDEMKEVLSELDQLGIFGINMLEFCFPYTNADLFREKGYKIKARPYRMLYNYAYGGGLPVAGSESVCLDLIEYALDFGFQVGNPLLLPGK